jgi:hypothetical protein
MTTHDLKIWPVFFEAVRERKKTFEIRKNDRGFQTGDTLLLRKFDPESVRGPRYVTPNGDHTIFPSKAETIRAQVTYVLSGFGIKPDSVVMGIRLEDTYASEVNPRDGKYQIYFDALAQAHRTLDSTWNRELDDDWDINDPALVAQQVMQRYEKVAQLVTRLHGLVSSMESDGDTPAWCPDALQSILAEYETKSSKS